MYSILGDKFPLPIKECHFKGDSQSPPSSTVWVGLDAQNGTMVHEAVRAQSSTAGQLLGMTLMEGWQLPPCLG